MIIKYCELFKITSKKKTIQDSSLYCLEHTGKLQELLEMQEVDSKVPMNIYNH